MCGGVKKCVELGKNLEFGCVFGFGMCVLWRLWRLNVFLCVPCGVFDPEMPVKIGL